VTPGDAHPIAALLKKDFAKITLGPEISFNSWAANSPALLKSLKLEN
jgi:hypothetical protein